MTIKWDELSPEEILAKAKEIEQTAISAEKGVEALEAKRDELLVEVKKRKKAMRMLAERGIDPTKSDYEDKLSDLIASIDELGEKSGSNPPAPAGGPAGNPPGMGQPDTNNLPSDMNPEIKKMLERMGSQITDLNTRLADKEKEIQEKEKESNRNLVKTTVIDKLVDLGIKKKRAEHLFRLTEDKYHLVDDGNGGKTVNGGDEYDPVPLDTVIGNLRDSDDFGDYFPGSGNSGSGLQGSQGGKTNIPIAENPFAVGSANGTEAAKIMTDNPTKGKQMMLQARAAGKLDPTMAKAFLK